MHDSSQAFQRAETDRGRKYSEGRWDIERAAEKADKKELNKFQTDESLRLHKGQTEQNLAYNQADLKQRNEYLTGLGMTPWEIHGASPGVSGSGGGVSGVPGPIAGAATAARGKMAADQAGRAMAADAAMSQASIGMEASIAQANIAGRATEMAAEKSFLGNQLGHRLAAITNLLSQRNQMHMTKFESAAKLVGELARTQPRASRELAKKLFGEHGAFWSEDINELTNKTMAEIKQLNNRTNFGGGYLGGIGEAFESGFDRLPQWAQETIGGLAIPGAAGVKTAKGLSFLRRGKTPVDVLGKSVPQRVSGKSRPWRPKPSQPELPYGKKARGKPGEANYKPSAADFRSKGMSIAGGVPPWSLGRLFTPRQLSKKSNVRQAASQKRIKGSGLRKEYQSYRRKGGKMKYKEWLKTLT